ncbi:hypothetical protein MTR67_015323 [Solanum verrucosum]|uniref:Uncharacterized protein n=1 Tax=Solanum verrucosum TaxID=315347 RepID=A0AAF0TNX8_SOLVR|nr:hypothetical protein MTR67_015323 [Solanum verrucosum]
MVSITNGLRLHLSVIHHGTLSKLIHRFPHLNSIDLSNFDGDLELILFAIAKYVPNLVRLDLSKHSFLPIEGLKELGRKLNGLKCRNLTSIRDSCLYVIAESFQFLEELDIRYPRNPSFLNRHELFVTDSGIEVLSVNLSKINVSGNSGISDRSMVALYRNCLNLQCIREEVTLKGIFSIERACAALSSISVSNIPNIGCFKDT